MTGYSGNDRIRDVEIKKIRMALESIAKSLEKLTEKEDAE